MKLLPILISLLPLLAAGGESYFFIYSKEAPRSEKIIGDKHLQIEIPIQKIDPPRASSIYAYHQGLGPGREYQIQINLSGAIPEDWAPMLKLDDDIIIKGIHLAHGGKSDTTPIYSLQGDDPEKIQRWTQLLADLLKIPPDKIEIDLTKGGWDTKSPPDEKPAGEKNKPKPEKPPTR